MCLVAKSLPVSVMQSIAAEMNLSETAFVEETRAGLPSHTAFRHSSTFNLRWFTLKAEVPLCGHATLAAAAVLLQGAWGSAGLLLETIWFTKVAYLTLQEKRISKMSFISKH